MLLIRRFISVITLLLETVVCFHGLFHVFQHLSLLFGGSTQKFFSFRDKRNFIEEKARNNKSIAQKVKRKKSKQQKQEKHTSDISTHQIEYHSISSKSALTKTQSKRSLIKVIRFFWLLIFPSKILQFLYFHKPQ